MLSVHPSTRCTICKSFPVHDLCTCQQDLQVEVAVLNTGQRHKNINVLISTTTKTMDCTLKEMYLYLLFSFITRQVQKSI